MRRTGVLYNPTVGLFLFIWIAATFLSCSSNRQKEDITPSAEYAPYISAYTGGIISLGSAIRIELTQELPMVEVGKELEKNPFRFSPSLKGKSYWVDNRTIEFIPDEGSLKPGAFYEATFELGTLVEVEEGLKEFAFSFRVQERNFALHVGMTILSDAVTVEGTIQFSDIVSQEEVKKMLRTDNTADRPIEFEATEQADCYRFSIRQIPRQEKEYALRIIADGSATGIDRKEERELTVPAKGDFHFLSAQRIGQPENGIEVSFSDPVSATQDLKGLIEIPEVTSPVFQVKDNKVFVYFEAAHSGKLTVKLHEGIRNEGGKALEVSHTLSLGEQTPKPQVEMGAEAAILPDSKNLIIPFRAVNLYAVDVSIIRIFESNVLMFMQTNTLSSANELRRSGRLVCRKTLWLTDDSSKDVHRWENYSLDLTGLIRQEPGAIYRVVLSFRQEYSAYPCNGENGNMPPAGDRKTPLLSTGGTETLAEEEEAEWDVPQAYYYYNGNASMDWSLYKWKERDNPCHPSYYMAGDRSAACNVYASNLGMTVKRNSLHKLWIAVNNILDTHPVEKAIVTAYNFQLQPVGKGETDSDGFAEITPEGVPFIVVAESERQKAYVRVANGEELSISHFDVGGKDIQKGLKGFIYGERGVWRPGDTLHVSFILEDREKRIPDRHPVSLEIYNPKGQFYTKMVSTQGMNGIYTFHVPTEADDPTGIWHAYVKVGGTAFHKSLLIETVKPNRLKIDLAVPTILEVKEKKAFAVLSSSWLTGAKAAGLRAKVEMSLSKVHTQFKQYPSYTFNDPATEFTTVKTEVFDGKLDKAGVTSFDLALPPSGQAPGMLNAALTTRVFEPGGDASVYTQTVPFSPYESYVGIDLAKAEEGKYLETDRQHVFKVVTVDCQGNPTNRFNLEYRIYKIDWSWWWEHSDRSLGSYIHSSSATPVDRGNLQTLQGRGTISFRVNYPDWGRYLVYVKDRESGHATGGVVYVDWPEWRGRSDRKNPDGIQMLTFSLDKEAYQTGETVTAILPPSAGGRALVSLENGSTVLMRKWVEVSGKEDTKVTFEATPEMTPNAYLHISLLQPHAQTVNDLPIRMYGVVPVFVTDRTTVLQPQINMPETLRPETGFHLTVSERNGRPMTYTLAIVDEGLLDLTGFKTPDPYNEFYAREALGIRTWDMYDDVLGAAAGKYSPLFGTGGDATLKPSDGKANRFKPVVKFAGPFYVGKGKRQTHTLQLPMYVGSVRAMVVAAQDGAYGRAEKTVPVRAPLMMLSTLPRTLSTQEEITVPVNIFAMEKQVRNVEVSLTASGGGVQVVGANRQTMTFDHTGDQLTFFTIRTADRTGKATLHLTATGGGQKTHETIEIDVRNPNPTVTRRESRWIEAGQEATIPYQLAASSAANEVYVEVSRIPSVDLSRRLEFLADYRHQCTEQLTSKALPLLFAEEFGTTKQDEEERTKAAVQEGISHLYARQSASGGFVNWPGKAVADEWTTSYVGMLLILAQEKGYAVHPEVLDKWKRFQRAAARNWRIPQDANEWQLWQSELQQAFRLYTLALAGAPEYGAMNRMKEQKALSLQARWRLAAAYALTGKTKPADELTFRAQTEVPPYPAMNSIYGSSLRDEAMILETLILTNRTAEALEQAKRVSGRLAEEEVFCTQSTAFALAAMGRLAEKLSGSLEFAWVWNGRQQPEVKSAKAMFRKKLTAEEPSGSVTVTNKGEGLLNADVITRTQLLNDTLPAMSEHIAMEIAYRTMDGQPVSTAEIKQGTEFTAAVTVTNLNPSADYEDLALTHILPSGWEIYGGREANASAYDYRDIRDDRVLTYFRLRRGERKTFSIRLQATYPGSFVLPAIQCESMYDPTTLARTKAGRTVVVRE